MRGNRRSRGEALNVLGIGFYVVRESPAMRRAVRIDGVGLRNGNDLRSIDGSRLQGVFRQG